MSSVSIDEVRRVAELANLELTPEEEPRMQRDLNSILGHIAQLNELDTSDVPPMAQISAKFGRSDVKSGDEIVAAWREDVPVPCLPHTEAVKNAPETDGDFFKVPKVIER